MSPLINAIAEELQRRRARNRRYSLRAFALSLGIDHATLSQLLRGVRRATPRTIRALGPRLGMSANEIAEACAEANDAALLGLMRRGVEPSSRWVAERIGLSVDDVNISLQRLLRKRIVAMQEVNRWTIL